MTKAQRGGAVRYIGGLRFISRGPGVWISECEDFSVVHMLAGTSDAVWEMYRTLKNDPSHERVCGTPFNDMHEHLESAITLSEIAYGYTIEERYGLGPGTEEER